MVVQVLKVRVESVDAAKKRLSLSLVARKTGAGVEAEAAAPDPLGGLQPGDLVRGTVAQVQRKQVRQPTVQVHGPDHARGDEIRW